jgi:8-oxo-dGTP pyrophosphatase MutT (NUDIX family)
MPSGQARWEEDVTALRSAVQASDYQLDVATYDRARALFGHTAASGALPDGMRSAVPEYGQEEFFRPVDAAGQAVPIPAEILQDYDALIERHAVHALWFRPAEGPGGERVLLVARWLCHLAGFRHRTVELLLDHPLLADHVLVQVRGMDKADAPACFDLPVAGHVAGLSTLGAALAQECEEELGLTRDMVEDLRCVGSYDDHSHLEPLPGFWNVEYRTLYRGQLAREAWLHLTSPSDEVAGIAVFSLSRLHELMLRFPDRVASALGESWSFYA